MLSSVIPGKRPPKVGSGKWKSANVCAVKSNLISSVPLAVTEYDGKNEALGFWTGLSKNFPRSVSENRIEKGQEIICYRNNKK